MNTNQQINEQTPEQTTTQAEKQAETKPAIHEPQGENKNMSPRERLAQLRANHKAGIKPARISDKFKASNSSPLLRPRKCNIPRTNAVVLNKDI